MMAAIMNSTMLYWDTAILDSDTLLSSLWFTQKHSHSTLTLNQTNSIWLKLIPSHLTWWWQASWILPSWIRPFCTKLWLKLIQSDSKSFILSQLDDGSHLEFCLLAFNHFAQKKLHSFILTQLDDGSHLEFCHLGFSHYAQTLTQTNSIWLKLIHSHLTWWWQPSWILPSWIQPFCTKKTSLIHSDSTWWWQPFWNSAMLDSDTAILDSDTLLSSLRFTQKHSHSNLTLTQTNSIWLKLNHSHLTWWWQPSWILPCWILPSWIQLS